VGVGVGADVGLGEGIVVGSERLQTQFAWAPWFAVKRAHDGMQWAPLQMLHTAAGSPSVSSGRYGKPTYRAATSHSKLSSSIASKDGGHASTPMAPSDHPSVFEYCVPSDQCMTVPFESSVPILPVLVVIVATSIENVHPREVVPVQHF